MKLYFQKAFLATLVLCSACGGGMTDPEATNAPATQPAPANPDVNDPNPDFNETTSVLTIENRKATVNDLSKSWHQDTLAVYKEDDGTVRVELGKRGNTAEYTLALVPEIEDFGFYAGTDAILFEVELGILNAVVYEFQSFKDGVFKLAFANDGQFTPVAEIPDTGTATYTGEVTFAQVSEQGEFQTARQLPITISPDFGSSTISGSVTGIDVTAPDDAATFTNLRMTAWFSGQMESTDIPDLEGVIQGSFIGPDAIVIHGTMAAASEDRNIAGAGSYMTVVDP